MGDTFATTVAKPIGREFGITAPITPAGCAGVLDAGMGIAVEGEGALVMAPTIPETDCVAVAVVSCVLIARTEANPPVFDASEAGAVRTGTGSSILTGEG